MTIADYTRLLSVVAAEHLDLLHLACWWNDAEAMEVIAALYPEDNE